MLLKASQKLTSYGNFIRPKSAGRRDPWDLRSTTYKIAFALKAFANPKKTDKIFQKISIHMDEKEYPQLTPYA